MRDSKLVHIINQLTNKELQIIGSSLTSTILEGKKHHQQIFEWIVKKLHTKREMSRGKLAIEIFGRQITDAKVRLYMSELFKLISAALVMMFSKNDEPYHDKVLISRFKHDDNEKLIESQFVSSYKRLKNHNFRNAEYLELKYEIGFQKYQHISSSKRTRDLNLQELLDGVDHIYISKKLRQACFAVSHQSVYGQEYDYGLLPSILTHLEQNDLFKYPSIRLYYSGYKMLSSPKDASYFNAFKKDIDDLKQYFPDEELQGIYRFAINQCIRLINRGQLNYGNIALDLYGEALNNRYLLVDGYLSRFTYRNIAAIAVKIGEYERAEDFSSEYQGSLRKEERNSAYNFNRALIGYHRKHFDTALQSLQEVDFKDHLFNLAAKVIQMKIYYESNEFDLLDSHLDAMQMYLLRKKVIGYHKTNYKNIIKLTRRLLKLKPNDAPSIHALMTEIEGTEVLTEKKWLLEQL